MTSSTSRSSNHFPYEFLPWTNSAISMPQQNTNIKPPPKRSNRPTKRTTFTSEQVTLLELEFAKNEYICKDRRGELAQIIDLTECQVKTWFQNRRTKKRRCNSPLRRKMMTKNDERSPSPYNAPSQHVPNLQTFFQGWSTHLNYPTPTDQNNKNSS